MESSELPTAVQAVSEAELLLASIRTAVLRTKLDASELTTIGIALRAGMISPEIAVAWLADIGLVDQVIAEVVS